MISELLAIDLGKSSSQAQLDAVNAEGFDEAQGYRFSRPMPASELLVFLAERAIRPLGRIV